MGYLTFNFPLLSLAAASPLEINAYIQKGCEVFHCSFSWHNIASRTLGCLVNMVTPSNMDTGVPTIAPMLARTSGQVVPVEQG